jgi:hypothetical protein
MFEESDGSVKSGECKGLSLEAYIWKGSEN